VSASSVIPLASTRTAIDQSRRRQRNLNRVERTELPSRLPILLTPVEVAALLRTSRSAIYAMVERGQLPGVVRIGRRVLLREADLVEWLRQKSAPSANEVSG
jgi:excisionase family DNA binding protein